MEKLTINQLRVLQMTAEGYTNKETAKAMATTEAAIKSYLRAIRQKYNATDTVSAIEIAREKGIIK